jgi:hypothetical protein
LDLVDNQPDQVRLPTKLVLDLVGRETLLHHLVLPLNNRQPRINSLKRNIHLASEEAQVVDSEHRAVNRNPHLEDLDNLNNNPNNHFSNNNKVLAYLQNRGLLLPDLDSRNKRAKLDRLGNNKVFLRLINQHNPFLHSVVLDNLLLPQLLLNLQKQNLRLADLDNRLSLPLQKGPLNRNLHLADSGSKYNPQRPLQQQISRHQHSAGLDKHLKLQLQQQINYPLLSEGSDNNSSNSNNNNLLQINKGMRNQHLVASLQHQSNHRG